MAASGCDSGQRSGVCVQLPEAQLYAAACSRLHRPVRIACGVGLAPGHGTQPASPVGVERQVAITRAARADSGVVRGELLARPAAAVLDARRPPTAVEAAAHRPVSLRAPAAAAPPEPRHLASAALAGSRGRPPADLARPADRPPQRLLFTTKAADPKCHVRQAVAVGAATTAVLETD